MVVAPMTNGPGHVEVTSRDGSSHGSTGDSHDSKASALVAIARVSVLIITQVTSSAEQTASNGIIERHGKKLCTNDKRIVL